ncbi:hypothetical protein T11_13129 [Trichinella zimbabwensis]|uniref:Uncharacterized protein n=2 Tax=Trichinella TaxID=6333 RepID=A0A0V1MV47_9BILA|nr:hypothetical protein T11_13129 [Trichinella zimbabwensis]KRZ75397.1 hypothetical protein T10_6796 [Trichinella papuae]
MFALRCGFVDKPRMLTSSEGSKSAVSGGPFADGASSQDQARRIYWRSFGSTESFSHGAIQAGKQPPVVAEMSSRLCKSSFARACQTNPVSK